MSTFSLNDHQLGVAEVHHNLPPSSFYEQRSKNSATAVLVVFSLHRGGSKPAASSMCFP